MRFLRGGSGAPVPKRRASPVLPSIFSSLVIGGGGGGSKGAVAAAGAEGVRGGGGENGGGDANLVKWKDSAMKAFNIPFCC